MIELSAVAAPVAQGRWSYLIARAGLLPSAAAMLWATPASSMATWGLPRPLGVKFVPT